MSTIAQNEVLAKIPLAELEAEIETSHELRNEVIEELIS